MKIHRTCIEDREAGLSMPEIMLGLSVLAIVAAAGITAYNNVQPRVRANTLYSGLQGFMVDAAQYLAQYHSEVDEGSLAGNASNEKTWAAATDAAVADITIACTGAGTPHPGCTSGTPGTPVNENFPNPNMQRWTSLPSLRFGDDAYDEDTDAEWHIPVGGSDAIEVAFEIMPAAGSTTGLGSTATASANVWDACTITNAAGEDTAVLVEMAIETKDVCDNLSQMVNRLDHVQSATCYDDETDPDLEAAHFVARTDEQEALMVVCFSVM